MTLFIKQQCLINCDKKLTFIRANRGNLVQYAGVFYLARKKRVEKKRYDTHYNKYTAVHYFCNQLRKCEEKNGNLVKNPYNSGENSESDPSVDKNTDVCQTFDKGCDRPEIRILSIGNQSGVPTPISAKERYQTSENHKILEQSCLLRTVYSG